MTQNNTSKTERQFMKLIEALANDSPDFHETLGPGEGNRSTNRFVAELRRRAHDAFGDDFSEQRVSGDNAAKVDYYFPNDRLVIEVAFGLKRSLSEFEKDVCKVVLAKTQGCQIDRLLFVTKPGGAKKCGQPFRKAVAEWVTREHGIEVVISEIERK